MSIRENIDAEKVLCKMRFYKIPGEPYICFKRISGSGCPSIMCSRSLISEPKDDERRVLLPECYALIVRRNRIDAAIGIANKISALKSHSSRNHTIRNAIVQCAANDDCLTRNAGIAQSRHRTRIR